VLMEQDEGALSYGLLESDMNTLEVMLQRAAAAAQWSNASRYEQLMAEAEKRLLLFRRRADVDEAAEDRDEEGEVEEEAQSDKAVMNLKICLADISSDPGQLALAIRQFEDSSVAVQMSKAGVAIKTRAVDLQRLWEYRRHAVQKHIELQGALQESLRNEFGVKGEEEDSDDEEKEDKLDLERLEDAIKDAKGFKRQMAFDLCEAAEVIVRHKSINKMCKAELAMTDALSNPRADEAVLQEAVDTAEKAGVNKRLVNEGRAMVKSWAATSEKTTAFDELFTAMRELRLNVENRTKPGAGAEEQRRVRQALITAQLAPDHPQVLEAGILLKRWEADNMALRVEARLMNAVNRAQKGYKQNEPKAGDLLGCAIAEVAQQGVSATILEEARQALDTWFQSRKKRAVRDLGYAREYRDENFLRDAIAFGEEAGCDAQLIEESKFDLQRLQWEEEVNKMLDTAMEGNDIEVLEKAVQRAHQGYFTEDTSIMLEAGSLQFHLRFWADTFRQVQVTKNAEGLHEDVKVAYKWLAQAQAAKERMIKDDASNDKRKEPTPEVVLRTLERDMRGLQLVITKARDMGAVFDAEANIMRVLGAVEKYAPELPEVIEKADKQVSRGLNKKYVIEAKERLKEYQATLSVLQHALNAGLNIPANELKSALIKARLAGAPQELVEKGSGMLEERDPDLKCYMEVELELLLAKAEADDIDELNVEQRFLRIQDAADEGKRLNPPLDDDVLEEVHGYCMALAAEKAFVEAHNDAKEMLEGTKACSPADIDKVCGKLSIVAEKASNEALDEVKKLIPPAEECIANLEKDIQRRTDILAKAQKLGETKQVGVQELKRTLVEARESFLPISLLESAYARLRKRKLESLPTDIRAAMSGGSKAAAAGLWQRGLVYKAHEAFSDWAGISETYEKLAGKQNLICVTGTLGASSGSYGTHTWRQNPYFIIRRKKQTEEDVDPKAQKKKKKGKKGDSKSIKLSIVIAEAGEAASNLSLHVVRNRQKVAGAAAKARCKLLLAPGPEMLSASNDDKGLPTCTLELPPPDEDWPIFVVPSAPKGEEGPFMIIMDASSPVELVKVEDTQRSPWMFDQTLDVSWKDERPYSKNMGGGRCAQKAPAMSWYRNPQFRIRLKPKEAADYEPSEPGEIYDRYIGVPLQQVFLKRQPLKIVVVGARGLRNTDYLHGRGTSDPYVTCHIKSSGGDETEAGEILFKTPVIQEDTNPIWNFTGTVPDYKIGETIVLTCYDEDEGKKDDLLGVLEIPVTQFYSEGFFGELRMDKTGRTNSGADVEAFMKIHIGFLDPDSVESQIPASIPSSVAQSSRTQTQGTMGTTGGFGQWAANPAATPPASQAGPASSAGFLALPPVQEAVTAEQEELLKDMFDTCDQGDGTIDQRGIIRLCRTNEIAVKLFRLPDTTREVIQETFQDLFNGGDNVVGFAQFRSFYVDRILGSLPATTSLPAGNPPGSAPAAMRPAGSASSGGANPMAAELYQHAAADMSAARAAWNFQREQDEQDLRQIFQLCDKDGGGAVSKIELIKIVRSQESIASFFGLPSQIRQEDGSRDKMERLFQHLDKDGDRNISFDEFLQFYTEQVTVIQDENGAYHHVLKETSAGAALQPQQQGAPLELMDGSGGQHGFGGSASSSSNQPGRMPPGPTTMLPPGYAPPGGGLMVPGAPPQNYAGGLQVPGRPASGRPLSGVSSRSGSKAPPGEMGTTFGSEMGKPASSQKPIEPMLLICMVPERGVAESPYALHVCTNRPGTEQYNEDRVVENFRGHNLVCCTVPNKKKLSLEYQTVSEVGAACTLTRPADLDPQEVDGDVFFVVPSLETQQMTGKFTVRFLCTEKIEVEYA